MSPHSNLLEQLYPHEMVIMVGDVHKYEKEEIREAVVVEEIETQFEVAHIQTKR